jgi:hypothetical protein
MKVRRTIGEDLAKLEQAYPKKLFPGIASNAAWMASSIVPVSCMLVK